VSCPENLKNLQPIKNCDKILQNFINIATKIYKYLCRQEHAAGSGASSSSPLPVSLGCSTLSMAHLRG
jgi:hypothetical protein